MFVLQNPTSTQYTGQHADRKPSVSAQLHTHPLCTWRSPNLGRKIQPEVLLTEVLCIPPFVSHNHPHLQVMDVRAQMFAFPQFRGLGRSYWLLTPGCLEDIFLFGLASRSWKVWFETVGQSDVTNEACNFCVKKIQTSFKERHEEPWSSHKPQSPVWKPIARQPPLCTELWDMLKYVSGFLLSIDIRLLFCSHFPSSAH